jgi:hypothetical protein
MLSLGTPTSRGEGLLSSKLFSLNLRVMKTWKPYKRLSAKDSGGVDSNTYALPAAAASYYRQESLPRDSMPSTV